MGRQMTQLGAGLTRALTLPLIAVGAAMVKVGADFDQASDVIRAATGATGKELEALNASFRKVFASVPASAQAVAEAIGAIRTRTGLTGQALEMLTTQMLNLARVGKAEIGSLVASTTRSFGDWSIATEKQSAALDFLFKTSQQTGIGITRLTDLVVQFGAPMRALGFTFEETAALMGKFEKEGVNLETVMSGMRFALGKFAAAGQEPAEAFRQVQEAIRNAKTETEATAIAFNTFGRRAAVDMSRAILEGRFNIDEFVKTLQNSKETINSAAADTRSLSERFIELKNRVMVAVEPIGTALVKALEHAFTVVEPLLDALGAMATAFGKLPGPIQGAAFAFAALSAAIGPLLFVFGQLVTGASLVVGAFAAKGLATARLIPLLVSLRTAILGITWVSILAGATSLATSFTTLGASTLAIGGRIAALATAIRGITFASLISGAAGAGLALKGLAVGALAVVAPIALIGSALLGLYQILRAGVQAWGLYTDAQARAAGAAKEEARQQAILNEATKIAGRPITDLAEAKRIYYENVRKVADANIEAAKSSQVYTERLKALQGEVAKLTANQRQQIDAALKAGASQEEVSKSLRISLDVVAAYTSGIGKAGAATGSYGQKLSEVQKIVAGFTAEQRANIVAGAKLGDNNKEIAASLNLTGVSASIAEAAVKLYRDSLTGAGKTAEQVAEGPFKKLRNQIIELDAQFKAAEKEGPAAYALALRENRDALAEMAVKAQILGAVLTDRLTKAMKDAKVTAADLRDEWARAIEDMDILPGGAEASEPADMREFEQDLKTRKDAERDLVRLTQESELKKLAARIETAKRGNATSREVFELERDLATRHLQFQIANAEAEFREQAKSHDLQTESGRRAYDALEAAHEQSVDNMVVAYEEGIRAQEDATFRLGRSLRDVFASIPKTLANAFEGGGGLMGALKSIAVQFGEVFSKAMSDAIAKALAKMPEGWQGPVQGGGMGGAFRGAAGVGLVSGIGAGMSGGSSSQQLASIGLTALGVGTTAAMMGASIASSVALGAATMGIGAAVIGVIALYKAKHMAEWEKLGADIGRDFGVALSKETLKAWEKESKLRGRQAVGILHLQEIIEAAGGLKSDNLEKFTGKLHDVFSLIEMGQISVAEGTKIIDDNWQAFVDASTDGSGRISKALREIIQLNDRLGTQSKEIAKFQKEQAGIAIVGFSAVVAGSEQALKGYSDLGKEVEAAKEEVKELTAAGDQSEETTKKLADAQLRLKNALDAQGKAAAIANGELADLGVIAVAVYGAAIAKGMSHAEAIAAAGPGLLQLRQAYLDLGLSAEDAGLQALFVASAIQDKNPQLLAAVGGLTQAFVALDNIGMLNADTFAAMQRQGLQMYTRLQAAAAETGGATRDALLPMQGYLREAAKQADLLQVPLDDNLQMLIDQSKELGIWKDEGKNATDTLKDAVDDLGTTFKEVGRDIRTLVDELRGIPSSLPNPFKDWAIPEAPDLPTTPNRPAPGIPLPPDRNRAFEEIEEGANAARVAVDRLNFGASPGGLKELPILLVAATQAMSDFAMNAVANVAHVKRGVDDLSRVSLATVFSKGAESVKTFGSVFDAAEALWGASAEDMSAALQQIDSERSTLIDRQLTYEEQARADALDAEWDFLRTRLDLRKRLDAVDVERTTFFGRDLSEAERARTDALDQQVDYLRARWLDVEGDFRELKRGADPVVTTIGRITEASKGLLDTLKGLPSSLPNPFKSWAIPDSLPDLPPNRGGGGERNRPMEIASPVSALPALLGDMLQSGFSGISLSNLVLPALPALPELPAVNVNVAANAPPREVIREIHNHPFGIVMGQNMPIDQVIGEVDRHYAGGGLSTGELRDLLYALIDNRIDQRMARAY